MGPGAFSAPDNTIGQMAKSVNKYSILLPTYNERSNLPIIVYLLDKHLSSRYKRDCLWSLPLSV